ncbi:hypothetical protein GW17_00042458 [Ensete ventricosum]|nr:hypothetical protein GW17_00042458 [Ensete ventricosum]RZR93068.1 hypothetical protein BHM03_00021472 [Ensete ventricosum]
MTATQTGFKKCVASGQNTNFWVETWKDTIPLSYWPTFVIVNIAQTILSAADLMDDHGWNVEIPHAWMFQFDKGKCEDWNESHFRNCLVSVDTLFTLSSAATDDCLRVVYKAEGTAWPSLDQTPTVVDDYRDIIECDGSFNEELCNPATGSMIKDVGGRMVAAGFAACSADNPVLAEGLASLSGLSRMKTEG